MKVVGCMIWFDEQPSMLAASVAGLARVADEIVAVDGAYQLFPDARPRSHPDQAEAILSMCETMDVGCTIHRPRQPFPGNEVEKRQLSIQLAAPFCQDGDWILVWDADYHVMSADPGMIRWELEQTDKLAATYTLVDNRDLLDPDGGLAGHAQKLPTESQWMSRFRGLFRWTPDLAYGPAHYCLRGTYDGVQKWVFGPDLIPGQQHLGVDALDLGEMLVVYHRRNERTLVRRKAADGYYQTRDRTGIERIDSSTLVAA